MNIRVASRNALFVLCVCIICAWLVIALTRRWPQPDPPRSARVRAQVVHSGGVWRFTQPSDWQPRLTFLDSNRRQSLDTTNSPPQSVALDMRDVFVAGQCIEFEVLYGYDNQSGIWPFSSWLGSEHASLVLLSQPPFGPQLTLAEAFALLAPIIAAASKGTVGITPAITSRRWIVWNNVLFDTLNAATALAFLFILAYARTAIRRRSRQSCLRRGVCPRCEYLLAQSPHKQCPECGEPLTLHEQSVVESKRLL